MKKDQDKQVTELAVQERMDEFEQLVAQVANDCLPGFRVPQDILYKYQNALDEYSRGNFKWSFQTTDDTFGHLRATVRKYIRNAPDKRFVPMVGDLQKAGVDQDLVAMANKPINKMNDWLRRNGFHFDIKDGIEIYKTTLLRIQQVEFEWENRQYNREAKRLEQEIQEIEKAQKAHDQKVADERQAEADRRRNQLDRILGKVLIPT
jgi:hypothetical protein